MSHTNTTTNYALPQFQPTDKPAWLTDINGAFVDIDTTMKNNSDAAAAAQGDATQAITDAATADGKATTADAKGAGALASIEAAFDPTTIYAVGAKVIYNNLLYRCTVAVITPGPWTGSANWERITVDSLIDSVTAQTATNTSDISNINAALASKPTFTVYEGVFQSNSSGVIDSTNFLAGGVKVADQYCIVVSDPSNVITVCRYSDRYTFEVRLQGSMDLRPNTNTFLRVLVLHT